MGVLLHVPSVARINEVEFERRSLNRNKYYNDEKRKEVEHLENLSIFGGPHA